MIRKLIVLSVALFAITACSNMDTANINDNIKINQVKTNKPAHIQRFPVLARNEKLADLFKQWEGTTYRLGGTNKNGIDCSAFMQTLFAELYAMELPRSTSQQRYLGKAIKKDQLQFGDLVFFRKNRHVGLYIGNGQFMHASSSQGVTISSLDNQYWRRTYSQSRRIIYL